MKLSVVIPSYKEAENLDVLLPQIQNCLRDNNICGNILIIDTQEPMDDTKSVCERHDSDDVEIRYISRKNGNLYGDAIRTGIESADGDCILVMDADGSHKPDDIKRLYREYVDSSCDIVIGSRYIKGGDTDNPFILVFMSFVLNLTYRVLFHLNVKDVSDSFRVYNAERVKKLSLKCSNFDIVEELLISYKNMYPDMVVHEVPICFNKRVYGESKRNLVKFIFSYIKTIRRLKKIQRGKL